MNKQICDACFLIDDNMTQLAMPADADAYLCQECLQEWTQLIKKWGNISLTWMKKKIPGLLYETAKVQWIIESLNSTTPGESTFNGFLDWKKETKAELLKQYIERQKSDVQTTQETSEK